MVANSDTDGGAGRLGPELRTVYCETHTKHTDTVDRMQRFVMLKQLVHAVTTKTLRAKTMYELHREFYVEW
jgi:hypothetical protein